MRAHYANQSCVTRRVHCAMWDERGRLPNWARAPKSLTACPSGCMSFRPCRKVDSGTQCVKRWAPRLVSLPIFFFTTILYDLVATNTQSCFMLRCCTLPDPGNIPLHALASTHTSSERGNSVHLLVQFHHPDAIIYAFQHRAQLGIPRGQCGV